MSPSTRKPRVPKLCHHKRSGRAYATFHGRQISFGQWGDPAAEDAYAEHVARWVANGRQPLDIDELGSGALSAADVLARFLLALEEEKDATWLKNNLVRFKYACLPLIELFGSELASDFGPKKLKTVRQVMIDRGRLCRSEINARVQMVRRVFVWAVSEELVPARLVMGSTL